MSHINHHQQYLQNTQTTNTTRIGVQYQLDDKQLPELHTDLTCMDVPSYAGELVYSAQSIPSFNRLNQFLSTVSSYFYDSPVLYDEELTLQLLHRYNYNIDECHSVLEPIHDGCSEADDCSSYSETSTIHNVTNDDDNSEDSCAVCGEGGELIICDYHGCIRVYHIHCAGLYTVPTGEFVCPAHYCTVCSSKVNQDSPYICTECSTAYCQYHIPRNSHVHDMSILNTASNHNNVDNNDTVQFRCSRCRVNDDASTVLHERSTFLKQLQSILMQPSHPQLLQLYHNIIDNGGIQNLLNGSHWKSVAQFVQKTVDKTNGNAITTDGGIADSSPT